MQQFQENTRRSKWPAARRPAPLRQTYPLPSPNRCPLQSRRACHALPTLCLPRWLSGSPRVEARSVWQVQHLDPLKALSLARRARFFENDALASVRHSFCLLVSRWAPPWFGKIALSPVRGAHFSKNDALASAACSFCHPRRSGALSWLNKIMLSPALGAHFQK